MCTYKEMELGFNIKSFCISFGNISASGDNALFYLSSEVVQL